MNAPATHNAIAATARAAEMLALLSPDRRAELMADDIRDSSLGHFADLVAPGAEYDPAKPAAVTEAVAEYVAHQVDAAGLLDGSETDTELGKRVREGILHYWADMAASAAVGEAQKELRLACQRCKGSGCPSCDRRGD